MQDFLSFVADIFQVEAASLSLQTAFQGIPEWDSLMHLRLVMELEARYSLDIPLEIIPELLTLQAFYNLIP